MSEFDVVLLDFGGVCLVTPFELKGVMAERLGIDIGLLDWNGPFGSDPMWEAMLRREGVTERSYWTTQAERLSTALGREISRLEFMNLLFSPSHPGLIRPAANDVVARAQSAGYTVAVLTNDLSAFHGPEWRLGIPILGTFDRIVDCSHTGHLKPDPRAYEYAVAELGVPAQRMLFVDDLAHNLAGGHDAGMGTHLLDVTDAERSWADLADRLGL